MINASQEFKNKVNSGAKFVNYADITLRNGTVLNLTPSDFAVGGFSMSDEMTDGKFGIGFAIGKTIDVIIANHTNKFSTYDFYKSIIYMYVAVELEDGRVLKERKGKYYVINPTSPGDTIKLSGVDSMYLLDKPYNAKTTYPATLQSILSDCCLDCGINIGFGQFDKYNFVVNNRPEDATYRDVVSYVAQIAGYNARISNNDAMELIWYDTTFMGMDVLDGGNLYSYNENDTYDGGDFSNYDAAILFDGGSFTDAAPENVTKIKSLSVSTDEIIITGIAVENETTTQAKGKDDYVIKLKDNPLTIGKESEILQHLYNKLVGYEFRSLTCETVNNPLFEPYDACYIYDRKGNYYFTLINSVMYKINGFTTISCKADDPVRNESSYTSDAAKALVQAKRNTEMQLSNYDKAVQNMNMLAANAMGLYRDSEILEDNSVIYYESNRPITKNENGKCEFALDSVVYKRTGDGFFVSQDGGLSFVNGLDSQGNAILNVLSAIGITFDWARGGTLSLGGDGNVNGRLVVYDSSGKQVGKWDKDGITLPAGTRISWTQVTGTDNVAYKNDIPKNISSLENDKVYTTNIDVNSIITSKVTAQFVNALGVNAETVKVYDDNKELKGKWDKDSFEMTLDDGSKVVISPSGGFYRLIGENKNEYNSLFYTTTKKFSGSGEATITLPNEFKGKNVKTFAFIQSSYVEGSTTISYIKESKCYSTYNQSDNTIKVNANIVGYQWTYHDQSLNYISGVTYSRDYYLTNAYLSGNYINTQQQQAVSTMNVSNQITRYIYGFASTSSITTEMEVTIVALA